VNLNSLNIYNISYHITMKQSIHISVNTKCKLAIFISNIVVEFSHGFELCKRAKCLRITFDLLLVLASD
jgi:hypothetical protein